MKTLSILITILLLSSCAIHSGTTSTSVTNEPVIHKDIAVGVATTNVFLGIGGLSKDAIISEARKNMVKSRPLEGAEQYNNVDINVKRTYYLIGVKTKVTINADVIEPKDSINQASYSEEYLKKIASPTPSTVNSSKAPPLFAVGDSIIIDNANYQVGEIIHIWGDDLDRVEISFTDTKNMTRTKNFSINRIYKKMPEHRGLTQFSRTEHGVIYAFGTNYALVKMAGGVYTTMKYPK